MNPKTESIIDFLADHSAHIAIALAGAFFIAVGVATWPDKPTYQDMADMTVIVQTGRTECHYVPAWKTLSCVTMPPVYGPVAPTVVP